MVERHGLVQLVQLQDASDGTVDVRDGLAPQKSVGDYMRVEHERERGVRVSREAVAEEVDGAVHLIRRG